MSKRFLFGFLFFVLIAAILVRLFPHAPNFTPVGALALFAGVYLAKKSRFALLLPLGVMFLTDLFIGFYDFKLMAMVYLSFLFYAVFGLLIQKRKNLLSIASATLAGSFLFYLMTNFAVWAFSSFYPATLQGLMFSYSMALPFLKYTLLGDLFFVAVFFGAYELVLAALYKKQALLNEIKESLISLRR
tara:strand:- start:1150 stop:1713 length:564 start_codon:yes stop_codon:yes gene_type:complete